MLKKSTIASTIIGLALSGSALSYNFSDADALFLNRADGTTSSEIFSSATKARDAYVSITKRDDLTSQERVYAVAQAGRLDLFRAGMISNIDVKVRQDALDQCISFTKSQIADTNSQEYYYYYLGCVALRGKIADGFLERAKYGILMKGIQGAALQSTTDENGELFPGIEGGGILRILSAVRGNIKADPLGLYKPEEGLKYAKVTLTAPKSALPPFSEKYSGREMFENYYYYAQAIIALGLKNTDLDSVKKGSLLLKKISGMVTSNESKLHPERKPERDYYVRTMKGLAGQVDGCVSHDNWKKCLQDELGKE